MSIIHRTTLSPSKYELLAAWLPQQAWFAGDASRLEPIGAYRFDDPEGEVGIEGHLFTAGDRTVYHVPLTYRSAVLEGGEEFLVGAMEHGVLGTRYALDAVGDPVARAVFAAAMLRGDAGSREFTQDADGTSTEREPTVRVRGTGGDAQAIIPELAAVHVAQEGSVTVAETEFALLAINRIVSVDAGADPEGTHSLRGSWDGGSGALLASIRV